jgi:hypothetical protein
MRNRRTLLRAGICVLCVAALASCAVDGVGVDGSVGVGYVGGYYEPYGYDYGGWGPGYAVGPYRGGIGGYDRDHDRDRGRGHAPAFRAAPSGRSMPSIPGRSRGR